MKKGRTPQPSGITFASCRLYAATPEDHVYSLLFQVIAPSCNPRGSHHGHPVRSLYQAMRDCQCSFFGRPLLFSLLFSEISETNWPGKYDLKFRKTCKKPQNHQDFRAKSWSWMSDLNRRPHDYEIWICLLMPADACACLCLQTLIIQGISESKLLILAIAYE